MIPQSFPFVFPSNLLSYHLHKPEAADISSRLLTFPRIRTGRIVVVPLLQISPGALVPTVQQSD